MFTVNVFKYFLSTVESLPGQVLSKLKSVPESF